MLLFVHICCLLVNYSYFNMIKNQFAIKVAAAWSFGCFDRRQDLLKTSLPVFLPRKSLQVRVETGGILGVAARWGEKETHIHLRQKDDSQLYNQHPPPHHRHHQHPKDLLQTCLQG